MREGARKWVRKQLQIETERSIESRQKNGRKAFKTVGRMYVKAGGRKRAGLILLRAMVHITMVTLLGSKASSSPTYFRRLS